MAFDHDQAQDWSLWLALGTTGIVLILGWFNQVSLTQIFWRCGISFGVVYGLTQGSLFLFERSSADHNRNLNEELHKDLNNNPHKLSQRDEPKYSVGRMFDQAIGEQDPDELKESFAAGQINDALTDPEVDMEQRAEILRKMGWTAENDK